MKWVKMSQSDCHKEVVQKKNIRAVLKMLCVIVKYESFMGVMRDVTLIGVLNWLMGVIFLNF